MTTILRRLISQRRSLPTWSSPSSSLSTATAPGLYWRIHRTNRSNLIFGANTDVGKTLVSAGLVQAALERGGHVQYIKPMQCGGADEVFVQKHSRYGGSPRTENLTARTLFDWETFASPHTACERENKPVSDKQVLTAVLDAIGMIESTDPISAATATTTTREMLGTTTFVETAGGVLSPSAASPDNQSPRHATFLPNGDTGIPWGWIPQADLYQPIGVHAPVVLVGDGRLGGISATMSAMESLIIRGYDIAAIILIETGYENLSALQAYAKRPCRLRSGTGEPILTVPSQSIVSLPAIPPDPSIPLDDWYQSDRVVETFTQLEAHLQNYHEGILADTGVLRRDAMNVLWWPSTQHKLFQEQPAENDKDQVSLIQAASGDHYHLIHTQSNRNGGTVVVGHTAVDACTPTQSVPHGDSSLVLANAAAMGRYGSVFHPSVAHAPAVTLAQKLIGRSEWANRVMYLGDSPVEAALYMGLRTFHKRMGIEQPQGGDWAIVALDGCYYGDSLGVMNVSGPRTTYVEDQHPWFQDKALLIEPPTIAYENGVLTIVFPPGMVDTIGATYEYENMAEVMDITTRLLSNRHLRKQYKTSIEMKFMAYEHVGHNRKIASCILEPVWMGNKFVDPLWQNALVEIAKTRKIPIILDETNTVMQHLGVSNCAHKLLRITPDISTIGFQLTGGSMPLHAALVTNEVFETFLGEEQGEAFLYEHKYAAHPAGCVSALQTLDMLRAMEKDEPGATPQMLFNEDWVIELSKMDIVENSFALGSICIIAIREDDDDDTHRMTQSILERLRGNGVHAQAMENRIVIIVSPFASKDTVDWTSKAFVDVLRALKLEKIA